MKFLAPFLSRIKGISLLAFPALFCVCLFSSMKAWSGTETVIWDPNGKTGELTALPAAFSALESKLDAPATMTVSGSEGDLKSAVEGAITRDGDGWAIIDVEDTGGDYSGDIHIKDIEKMVVRAAAGHVPKIDCSRNYPQGGVSSYWGDRGIYLGTSTAAADGTANNVAICGLTFKNNPYHGAWLRGAVTNLPREMDANLASSAVHTVIIQDCTFENDSTEGGIAMSIFAADNIAVRRCYADKMGETTGGQNLDYGAFYFGPTTLGTSVAGDGLYFQNNYVNFSKTLQPRGFISACSTGLVEYCLVYGTGAGGSNEGIKIDGDASGSWSVSNCVVIDCNRGIRQEAASVTCLIENCISDGAIDRGIRIDGGTVTVRDSIVVNGLGRGIYSSGATASAEYCDVWNNASTAYTGVTIVSPIDADPQFTDAARLDYTLQGTSTLIGAGSGGSTPGINVSEPADVRSWSLY